ncbi:MAG TPA: hypothetical protein VNN09_06495 [Candidatus Competibacteraceae bacterium]|nr:hypothetical protein [Candidatus Competibacteraceae bacterium]
MRSPLMRLAHWIDDVVDSPHAIPRAAGVISALLAVAMLAAFAPETDMPWWQQALAWPLMSAISTAGLFVPVILGLWGGLRAAQVVAVIAAAVTAPLTLLWRALARRAARARP